MRVFTMSDSSRGAVRAIRAATMCLCIVLASCADEGDSGNDGGETSGAVDATARDVRFGQMRVTGYDTTGLCPITNTFMRFHASGGISVPEQLFQFTGQPADVFNDNTITRTSGLGSFRVALNDEVCASVTASNWESSPQVCHTIDSDSGALNFSLSLARPALADPQCEFRIELDAEVAIVDTQAICTASCAQLDQCGRVFDDCVAACVDDMGQVPFGEDPACNTATSEWLGCLHTQACQVDSPELACIIARPEVNEMFTNGQCRRPVAPPPPLPDPLACSPEQGDLVAGNVGDFYVISRTTDFPNRYYAIIDLTQLATVDEVLAASPGDPLLSTARSVVPALKGLDGTTRDLCPTNNIVAIQYEGNLSPQFIALADAELGDIQNRLDELAELAEDLKRQFVAFLFDSIFCPAVRSIYGFFFDIWPGGAAGIVLTEAAVILHGCSN